LFFHIILTLLLFLVSPSCLSATQLASLNMENQFTFAESLFLEGDYFRAITEYKRFMFLYPQEKLAEKASFKIAESYYKGKKWKESIESVDCFTAKYANSFLTAEALYIKGLSEKELKYYNNALTTFHELIKKRSLMHTDKAIFQTAIVLMHMEEWQEARRMFMIVPNTSDLYQSSKVYLKGLDHLDQIPLKSPFIAGTLATLLPGSGHLYLKHYSEAVASLLLNGAFIWAAVELFQHNNNVAGTIVSFFEVGWYSGNVYSAISSAHKYNMMSKKNFIQNIQEKTIISFSIDPKQSRTQLMLTLNF